MQEKRKFLIVTTSEERLLSFKKAIESHIASTIIYSAIDGTEGLFKLQNDPPHVLIIDLELPKTSGLQVVNEVLANINYSSISVIINSELPDTEHFVDEVVTGRVQFLTKYKDVVATVNTLTKALNYTSAERNTKYKVVFLAPGEVLFNEGDKTNSAFIVRRGQLRAFKGSGEYQVTLGNINEGEFVGEMAHITREARSASVVALTQCELIEIPDGAIDAALFAKPAWSKALMQTLSKRLKLTNEALVTTTNSDE